ncbi:hypothetical protein BDV95DRAFT_497909 [Massariosphaeria phaeospora]|uniref:Carboxylic ester hydrolase n=1 Tax=Massariosphaeria phaeospora TaxID=100035 RepID=A0A7C8M622_9PLEO|nr:hypothetical protein BDV95DRAFT_497909 [Massariosphaeria phaeospora]
MQFITTSLLALSFNSAAFGVASTDFKSRCEALGQGVEVPGYDGLSVGITQFLAKDSVIDQFAEGTNATCALPNPVVPVDLCRLALRAPTSNASEIHMEVWLPEQWNSRFLAVGTGGLAGCIFYQDLAYVTAYGFASVSSDSGHSGGSAGAFLNQPQVFEDFVWRSLYASTVIGKEVTKQLYGTPHKKSYYMGCSQGGRQGFKAAQSNPELFDGIVAGAPGLRLPGLFEHMTRWLLDIGTDTNNTTVSLTKWSAVQNETLRQCDPLDGATDGIVEDTRRCNPDLSKLECGKEGAPKVCLTPKDLSLITQFFTPWSVNSTLIYPGMAHNGDELVHATTLSSADPLTFALEWHRFVTRKDPTWTLAQWTPADALFAVQQNWFNFNTYEGDLSAFRDRGAKIIHYHGQNDQLLDSTVSDGYYEHVAHTMHASPTDLDAFYRYFRISGLQHCQGGPGASSIGQSGAPPPAGAAPEDNVLLKIVEWVEEGKAPETVRGAKFVDGDAAKGVEYKRRHCRYPLRNVYEGSGDGKDEEGWRCVE